MGMLFRLPLALFFPRVLASCTAALASLSWLTCLALTSALSAHYFLPPTPVEIDS